MGVVIGLGLRERSPFKRARKARRRAKQRAKLSEWSYSDNSNKTVASEEKPPRTPARVQEQSKDKNFTLPKRTYLSIKQNSGAPSLQDINGDRVFRQKTPLGNTVLHIAASYGNDGWVRLVSQKASELLAAENSKGDVALHVAARAGHVSTLRELLRAHLQDVEAKSFQEAMNEILRKNKQGNTFIHEALLNGHKEVMYFLSSKEDAPLPVTIDKDHKDHKDMALLVALFQTNNQNKSILYLAIEAGWKKVVEALIELASHTSLGNLSRKFPGFHKVIPPNTDPEVPAGKSPPLAAILKQDKEILKLILEKKPAWIKSRDTEGRTPLHYAASIGYLDGVRYLLSKCASCAIEQDNDGFFPLHLASVGGHVEVVKELLRTEYYQDPRELLDNGGRNFLHLAAASGKSGVVRYILKAGDKELEEMINDQDDNGNTPLHLATLHFHPKVVHALTWGKRVKLMLVNGENQTALDVCMQRSLGNISFRQRLTWAALKSAGVPCADQLPHAINVPCQCKVSSRKEEVPNMDQYRDKINTLILVSILIVTVTFAAGFTLPGGVKASDPGEGMALMLHRMWFKLFIFCITISMYGAISITIVLIWAQVGDLAITSLVLVVTKYCLGVTLATLSLALLAGVHLVISDLSWLANIALVMSVTYILMLLILYILLWLPSSSRSPIARLISYYPFLLSTSLVEAQCSKLQTASCDVAAILSLQRRPPLPSSPPLDWSPQGIFPECPLP